MVSKGSTLCHRCSVDCHPGGRRGNKEQVVTQWRRLVAFMKVLDLLHWTTMCAELHHRTAMAIKMASDGGTFIRYCRIFSLIKTQLKDHGMLHLN